MALNLQKTVSELRYDNTWMGKHKIQCYFKYSKMVDEVDNLVEFMLKSHLVRSQLPDLSFM